MPDFDAWMGDTVPLSTWTGDLDRAHDVARHIAEKPSSIAFELDDGTVLAAQTVRLEPLGGPGDALFQVGTVAKTGVLIVGYKGHPTIADTTLKRGARFGYGGQFYTVTQVVPDTPDRLLAVAEAREA